MAPRHRVIVSRIHVDKSMALERRFGHIRLIPEGFRLARSESGRKQPLRAQISREWKMQRARKHDTGRQSRETVQHYTCEGHLSCAIIID